MKFSIKKNFNYSYVIIAICFLVVCVALGLCSSGRSMYLTAITDALDISRGAFSLNDTFRFVSSTIVNIFFGALVNKFGTKKLLCAGFVCLIAFAVINSLATELYMFYIAGILLGVGLAWTTTTMISTILNTWTKEENRGKITGLVLSANGLGGAIAVQILSPIIFQEGNPFGYRNSYQLVAIVLAVVLAIIIIFFRERPKGVEKVEYTKKTKKARGRGWIGMEYSEVLKKPYFYLTLVCLIFTGMALQGLSGISTPHMYDVGISKPIVATITSCSSIIMMCSKFFAGFIYDKKGIKITMNICLFSSFVSLISLVFVSNTSLGIVLAYVRIVFNAIALPLETVMLPLYASELFGNKSFVSVLGVFSSANYVGFALGSPIGNVMFDLFGNYNVAFILFGALMVFVTIAMQFVVKYARKDKQLILENIEGISE